VADITGETPTGGAVRPLRELVRGRVITAADEGYDEARAVHNGMFDKRPLAVLMAEQVGDVIAAVRFAGEHGLDLAVRGGMHSGPGFGTKDDGLVIDMSQMRTVRVDPQSKTARAGAGPRGETSITRRTPLAWRPRAGSSRLRAFPVSRWAEASVTCPVASG
jgi:hypothetical protein